MKRWIDLHCEESLHPHFEGYFVLLPCPGTLAFWLPIVTNQKRQQVVIRKVEELVFGAEPLKC